MVFVVREALLFTLLRAALLLMTLRLAFVFVVRVVVAVLRVDELVERVVVAVLRVEVEDAVPAAVARLVVAAVVV